MIKQGTLVEITMDNVWTKGKRFIIKDSIIAEKYGNEEEIIDKNVNVYKSPFRSKKYLDTFCYFREVDLKIIKTDHESNISFTRLMEHLKSEKPMKII